MNPRLRLALRSIGAVIVLPGTVTLLIPWLLTGWEASASFPGWPWTRMLGLTVLCASFVLFADTVVRFAVQGRGTLAPVAPPERFVAEGPYRHVRNPMYVGVLGMLLGQALVLGRTVLFGYALLVWVAVDVFVIFVEEPRLRRRFGGEYERYLANVGRWLPRWRRRAQP